MSLLKARHFHCEVAFVGRQAQNDRVHQRESNYENHIFFERVKSTLAHGHNNNSPFKLLDTILQNQFNHDVKIKAFDER